MKETPRSWAGAIEGSLLAGVALRLKRSGNPQTLFELNPHRRGKTAEMLNSTLMDPACLTDAAGGKRQTMDIVTMGAECNQGDQGPAPGNVQERHLETVSLD